MNEAHLAARIKAALAIADRQGHELFGYGIRPDGAFMPMTRPKGLGKAMEAAFEPQPSSSRGIAASAPPPAQGSLL